MLPSWRIEREVSGGLAAAQWLLVQGGFAAEGLARAAAAKMFGDAARGKWRVVREP